jgi:hypothetical protein
MKIGENLERAECVRTRSFWDRKSRKFEGFLAVFKA